MGVCARGRYSYVLTYGDVPPNSVSFSDFNNCNSDNMNSQICISDEIHFHGSS